MIFDFCPRCTHEFPTLEAPQICTNCKFTNWDNPMPVAVMIQPFTDGGMAIARRAINPCYGEWSLIGGFMKKGEGIEEGAVREFYEETSIATMFKPNLFVSYKADDDKVLAFCASQEQMTSNTFFARAVLCPENLEFGILYPGEEDRLCFETHRKAAKKYFREYSKII